MAVYETQRKTKITIPNWAIAFIAVVLILASALLLAKYYPVISLWLQ